MIKRIPTALLAVLAVIFGSWALLLSTTMILNILALALATLGLLAGLRLILLKKEKALAITGLSLSSLAILVSLVTIVMQLATGYHINTWSTYENNLSRELAPSKSKTRSSHSEDSGQSDGDLRGMKLSEKSLSEQVKTLLKSQQFVGGLGIKFILPDDTLGFKDELSQGLSGKSESFAVNGNQFIVTHNRLDEMTALTLGDSQEAAQEMESTLGLADKVSASLGDISPLSGYMIQGFYDEGYYERPKQFISILVIEMPQGTYDSFVIEGPQNKASVEKNQVMIRAIAESIKEEK